MVKLVLLNGPPAIGKTTLATRLVADRPLALLLDIDAIRCSMGQWEARKESKTLARLLAAQMARVHLSSGHDVVVPQLLAQLPFIEVLAGVARATGAEFHEILLTATMEDTLGRFRTRREVMRAERVSHPEESVEHDAQTIEAIYRELDSIASLRPKTVVIHTTEGEEAKAYDALRSLVIGN
jgi:predicted kinase